MLTSTRLFDYQSDSLRMLVEQEDSGEVGGLLGHCVLTDPKGSGKSLVILALIASRPLPQNKNGTVAHVYESACASSPYISIRATVPNQIIRPTCIVSPSYAYRHWIDTIHKYTSFRLHVVASKKDAHMFCTMALNGDMNDYDIVLINYSAIRATSSTRRQGAFADICHLINCGSMPMIWARVVYDNVHDMRDATQMRAISSVYVSGQPERAYVLGTRMRARDDAYANGLSRCFDTSLRNIVCKLAPVDHIYNMQQDGAIWATCGHDTRVIMQDAHIPNITWISAIIGVSPLTSECHSDKEAELVVETYNGHHVNIGSHICPRSELLLQIIGEMQYNRYLVACARMIIIYDLREHDARAIDEYARTHSSLIDLALRKHIHYSENMPIDDRVQQREQTLSTLSELLLCAQDIVQYCDEVIKRCKLIVARVSENIARDECVVCYMPLHEANAVAITRCCGICLCAKCCLSIVSAQQSDTIQTMHGNCVQCRSKINVESDIIFAHYEKQLSLIDEMIKIGDSPSTHYNASNCIKTKINYIIELARNGCVPNNSPDIDVRVYNGPVYSKDILTSVASYGSASASTDSLYVARTNPAILVCSSNVAALKHVQYAARAESMNEHEILVQTEQDDAHAHMHAHASSYMTVIIINGGGIVPLIINASVMLPWITDIIVMDPIACEHMTKLIDLTQCIGRTQELRIHMLEYAHCT